MKIISPGKPRAAWWHGKTGKCTDCGRVIETEGDDAIREVLFMSVSTTMDAVRYGCGGCGGVIEIRREKSGGL